MLCQRVIVSCAQRNMPMPESLIELWHQMPPTGESGNPSRRLMPLLWQVLQLRSEINTGFLTDPETIVDRLLAIDQQFGGHVGPAPRLVEVPHLPGPPAPPGRL